MFLIVIIKIIIKYYMMACINPKKSYNDTRQCILTIQTSQTQEQKQEQEQQQQEQQKQH